MANSTRLETVLNIQTALRAIAVASGYHYTVKSASVAIDPVVLETVPPTELPFFIVSPAPPGTREFQPAFRMKDVWSVTIVARMDAGGDQSDFARKRTVHEHLVADIEKALTVDITRGGTCIDTRVLQPEEPVLSFGTQNIVIALVPVDLRSRRIYGQPSST